MSQQQQLDAALCAASLQTYYAAQSAASTLMNGPFLSVSGAEFVYVVSMSMLPGEHGIETRGYRKGVVEREGVVV